MITTIRLAILLSLLASSAQAGDYTLGAGRLVQQVGIDLTATSGSYETCVKQAEKRCVKQFPTPKPIPSATMKPTASPKPTGAPHECEHIGNETLKTFQPSPADGVPGETKILCFDETDSTHAGRTLVEVNSFNTGDASCGQFAAQLQSPSGGTYFSLGVAPQTVKIPWEKGRWYETVTYVWGHCPTLSFSIK